MGASTHTTILIVLLKDGLQSLCAVFLRGVCERPAKELVYAECAIPIRVGRLKPFLDGV